MSDEKLEFSAEDLGRLARYVGDIDGVLLWLDIHGTVAAEMRRVRQAVINGFNETAD